MFYLRLALLFVLSVYYCPERASASGSLTPQVETQLSTSHKNSSEFTDTGSESESDDQSPSSPWLLLLFIASFLIVAVLMECILSRFCPETYDSILDFAAKHKVTSAIFGAGLGFGLPVATLLLLASMIGIPLLLILLFLMCIAAPAGLALILRQLGSWIAPNRNHYGQVIISSLVLLIAMIAPDIISELNRSIPIWDGFLYLSSLVDFISPLLLIALYLTGMGTIGSFLIRRTKIANVLRSKPASPIECPAKANEARH